MKMHKMAVPAMLMAAAVAVLSGCSTMGKSYPISTPNVEILPLHRSEYVILGDTEGQACQSYLFGFIPLGDATTKYVNQPGQLINSLPKVMSSALYDAIDKVPGADSIMSVRVAVDNKFSVLGIYKHECVTVKGKAFELKTDSQAQAAP